FLRLQVDLQPTYVLGGGDMTRCTSPQFGACSVQVRNAGPDPIQSPVRVTMTLVNISTGAETTVKVWDDYTNRAPWLPGATLCCGTHTSSVGCGVTAGYYAFRVVADPANQIVETSEGNNVLTGQQFYLR